MRGFPRTKEGIWKDGEGWERNKAGGTGFSILLFQLQGEKETLTMTTARLFKETREVHRPSQGGGNTQEGQAAGHWTQPRRVREEGEEFSLILPNWWIEPNGETLGQLGPPPCFSKYFPDYCVFNTNPPKQSQNVTFVELNKIPPLCLTSSLLPWQFIHKLKQYLTSYK